MKSEILKILKENSDAYFSGELLSEMLNVSRTAVWKHIKALKNDGYKIDSVTNKGYRLISEMVNINQMEIDEIVLNSQLVETAQYFDSIDSTNQESKRIASYDGFKQTLILANEQTNGKGRLGRSWSSQKDSGIWLSLLLKPDISPESASKLTLIGAAAMSEAIEYATGLETGIKWPNDIVINGKKVCGILTEMSTELNHIHYLILGVGVNVSQTVFEEELSSKATSLFLQLKNNEINRLNIIKKFVERFEIYYNQFINDGLLSEVIDYNRKKSVTINKDVVIQSGNQTKIAFANDIDQMGNLIIKNKNGEKEVVFYGEVSVRGINGYV